MTLLARPSISTVSPESLGAGLAVLAGSPSGTVNWIGANMAGLVPFVLWQPMLAKRMIITNGSAVSGNVDAGIYTLDGALIVASGAVAHAGASSIQFLGITDTYLAPGRYYMAVSCSSATTRIRRANITVIRQQALGVLQASSAHPLPATVTFTSPTTLQIPMIGIEGFGVV